jgi:hypothetical protein
MAFELHIWGPAFGLDSIDAECLAAIACFRHILPSEAWSLITSNDTSVSPDRKYYPSLIEDPLQIVHMDFRPFLPADKLSQIPCPRCFTRVLVHLDT